MATTSQRPFPGKRTHLAAYYRRLRMLSTGFQYVLISLLSLIFIFPFLWLVLTSFKSLNEIAQIPPRLFPETWQFSNYVKAVNFIPFFQYMGNTVLIFVGKAVGAVISCSLVAYGFSVLKWPGRDAIFVLVLATMMLPFPVTMIPLYIVFTKLGWVGSFAPLIIPSWFGYAFSIFLFRQFFLTIPIELAEAARIDGCSEPQIYYKVIMPLAMPAVASIVLFEFMWTWNDFLAPLLYLSKMKNWTLALGLLQFRESSGQTSWEQLMAASTLTVIPAIVLYFIGQKTFIQGIATTGFK
jgi:multiple sugar transport system permease protein